jgi:hypothetical protein
MQGETIFRFYTTRPAVPNQSTTFTIQPYEVVGKTTNLLNDFKDPKNHLQSEKLQLVSERLINNFTGIKNLVITGKVTANDLLNWLKQHRNQPVEEAFRSIDFLPAAKNSNEFPVEISTTLLKVADLIGAYAFTGKNGSSTKRDLSIIFKLLYIYYYPNDKREGALNKWISNLIISLPEEFIRLNYITKKKKDPVKSTQKIPPVKLPIEKLEKTYCELHSTMGYPTSGKNRTQGAKAKASKGVNVSMQGQVGLGGDLADQLSAVAKEILGHLKLNARTTPVKDILQHLEQEINKAWIEDGNASMTTALVNIEGILVDKNKFTRSLTVENEGLPDLASALNSSVITATIGDLLLVKQKLKGYRLGELAHVENVLKGEKRERNHRRLNRTSEDFFTSTEKEDTKERDLSSTDRNELQSEMNRTATTELGIDLGVQVSGSYGPTISFDSQLDSHFSSTVEESQHKASTFSKELTEKSSEKIRELVKNEQRTISVEEVEEVNIHGFENQTGENITGVYRWLDKIYEAQVFNYGQRLMLDLIVPEPAAFYISSMMENEELHIEKPELPKYGNLPLAPANISRCNYMKYIRAYGVTDAPEPPPERITVSYFDKQEGKDKADYARSEKIQIPDNYAAFCASVGSFVVKGKNDPFKANILIGDIMVDAAIKNGWDFIVFPRKREKELALALHYNHILNFSAAIDVFCELTPTGHAAWQNKVYEAIMNGFQRKLDEYDEKMAGFNNRKTRLGNTVYGNSPDYNKTCCNDELRRLAIMVLSKNVQPDMNSYQDEDPLHLSMDAISNNSPVIRFFESAFEWNNLAYVMYPYFWGRRSRWSSAIQTQGNENEFSLFLKAGAARLQVAVRPGFERAVAYYLQSGQLWEGNDAALGADENNLPIIQEITENLGNEGLIKPYPEDGEPWEIVIPTTLVFLQKDIPVFQDALLESNG